MTPRPSTIPLIRADLPTLESLTDAFREILENGRVTNFGRYVRQFEQQAGDYLGAEAIAVSSGTAGLIMTLQALDVPPGSRVAIPSFSFVATAQAVLYAGCTPVFVDVASDGNVDPDDLARVLREVPGVRAAVLVHMYGLPCRTDEIDEVMARARAEAGHPIPLVYDAAHAFGAVRAGTRVGGFGDAEVFSTSVTKVLTSVEGGVVSSRRPDVIERITKMRNYGIESHYDAHYPGLNGKMSEFHALVGLRNLARLDTLIEARTCHAAEYVGLVSARTRFRPITGSPDSRSTYKDFTVVTPPSLKQRRDEVMASLGAAGIETRAYFHPPIHQQRLFARFADRPLPVTEDLSRRVITLPFFSSISQDEMRRVVDALAAADAALTPAEEVAT